MSVIGSKGFTISFGVILAALALTAIAASPVAAAAEEDNQDTYTFVTDEQTGALYECSQHGCVLIARPLPASTKRVDCSGDGDSCPKGVKPTVETSIDACRSQQSVGQVLTPCI